MMHVLNISIEIGAISHKIIIYKLASYTNINNLFLTF